MIALLGDIHGEFWVLKAVLGKIPADVPLIQVGDFGWWPRLRAEWDAMGIDRKVYFIDGNHDHVDGLLAGQNDWPNAEYVSRGSVLNIKGKRVLFFGGATSVDRKWRQYKSDRHGWFDAEIPSEKDVELAVAAAGGSVDLMVAHSPPDWMIRKHFGPEGLRNFGHDPVTWRDTAAERVERVWREIGQPPLYCGHMHRSTVDGNCRILDINEVHVFGT